MSKKILLTLVIAMLSVTLVHADPNGDATAKVFLNIDPNIAVNVVDAIVEAESLQTGSVAVPIIFRVDANTEAVALSAIVTNLYKGDDPTNDDVTPVLVKSDAGVDVEPANGNEIEGGDNNLPYAGATTLNASEGTFAGLITEVGTFESSQNGHFSQEVEVTPTWFNDDPEKPQGEYSGYVQLLASVVD